MINAVQSIFDPVHQFHWDELLANSLWISGSAIIIAVMGYYEFRGLRHKPFFSEISKDRASLKILIFGLVLVFCGIALTASIQVIGYAAGILAFLSGIILIRLFKNQD